MSPIAKLMVLVLLFTVTIWEAKSHHIIDDCEDFRTGVKNGTKEPLQGTLYTHAYRNLANNNNNGLECCRFIATPGAQPDDIDVQCTWINITDNNHVHRENITLTVIAAGLYNDKNPVEPELLEIVLEITSYGLFLYSCQPSDGENLIRFVTSTQDQSNIPWDKVNQKFDDFGFPGYQNVIQSPSVCTNY